MTDQDQATAPAAESVLIRVERVIAHMKTEAEHLEHETVSEIERVLGLEAKTPPAAAIAPEPPATEPVAPIAPAPVAEAPAAEVPAPVAAPAPVEAVPAPGAATPTASNATT